ncbi:MAG: archaellin/type IV pilin N-terminal domain-containing protein [Candidatus Anstonellales archaeon]
MKGDVGIGTLIVFIAMVLVAAVAASVLLNVSGMLQQRASSTGKETTKQVSSNLLVVSIIGITDANLTKIDELQITIKAAAGSGRLGLKNLLLRLDNGTSQLQLVYNSSCGGVTNDSMGRCYNLSSKVDPQKIFTSDNPVIDPSSIAEIQIKNLSNNLIFLPRGILRMDMVPEAGSASYLNIYLPEVYSGNVIPLYP